MKFTVNVAGADSALVQRLTAAADRKLAPRLRGLGHQPVHAAMPPPDPATATGDPDSTGTTDAASPDASALSGDPPDPDLP